MDAQTITIIVLIWSGLFSTLSAIFQLLGMTAASKVCGTLFALDVGRIIRYFVARTQTAKLQTDTGPRLVEQDTKR